MCGKVSIKSDCSISEMSVLSISNVVSGNTSTSLIRDREISVLSISKRCLIQFRGAIGKAYHRLYEQIILIKDELDYMLK